MARQSYLKNAAILTGTGLLLRAAGMFFRIYIAARIGAEGMGLYQLIMPVCSVLLSVTAVGLTSAVSNLTSQYLALGNRLGAARAFGAAHGCVLVLKGHRTLTAAPAGNVLVNTTGNSGLAKGGSGDVLTGIVAALLAQGATAVRAAAVGVWLHGRAGDLAAERLTPYGMTPEDVVSSLPAAIGEIL